MATSTKTQTIDDLTAENPKEGKNIHNSIRKMKPKIKQDSNHWSLISLNINGLNSSIKRHRLNDWIQKQNPFFFCIQETYLNLKDRHFLRVKGWENFFSKQMDLMNGLV